MSHYPINAKPLSFVEFQPFLIDYTSFNLAQDKDTLVFKIQSCTFKKAYGILMGFINMIALYRCIS